MAGQVINTALLQRMNPEYAEALRKGKKWAVEHARQCECINNGVRHPERKFTGKPRKHCSQCPFPEGCVMCDLE